ncbi:N-acetyltransferase [Desulfovibrio litoralis]|uniref:N-acetylglutamate synthase n=1 Tax=Desulfovibrio litoralis DSM 11393 TaxID=1121455 RepID=A0A1M7TBH8_9BACT|nr:N-acetyltransferase [Desulfovibrio litoralis]SHN68041.1 N-acetylglutamate synthase [Desulfovibrio litoralis DSM 11393]
MVNKEEINSSNFILRKAKIKDVKQIHALLMESAARGKLLARPLNQLYHHLREFVVVETEADKPIIACVALSITWSDSAEVRSLVVDESYQKLGLGRKLVEHCIKEAKEFELKRVFTLTYQVDFFNKLNFKEITKDQLPQKIWADCIHCPKFPECDETAMIFNL